MPADRKLQNFLTTIYDEATQDGQAVSDEVSARRSAFIAKTDDELLAEVYDHIRSKTSRIRTEAGRRVSAASFEHKRELYRVRAEIADEIIADVGRRVEAYTASDEYPAALEKIAQRATRELSGDGLVIYVRAEDMKYADRLRSITRAEIVQGEIKLGGIVAQNTARHLRLDLTYDRAMEDVRVRFGELSDFTLKAERGAD